MPCNSPIRGWRSRTLNSNGNRPIVFERRSGFEDMEVLLPCDRCMGCRLMYAQDWAIRAVHEARMHEDNSFLTLTYAPENLPSDYGLHKEHFQNFMKRLRKRVSPILLRFMMCGEYGNEGGRPHYHALIFGYGFPDKLPWKMSSGRMLYRSALLESVWTDGHSSIGEVNATTARYVAGYIRKKLKGKGLEEIDPETGLKPYELRDNETGEIIHRLPEYGDMSRRPGLGRSFFEQFGSEIVRDGFVVLDGTRMRVPSYYDDLGEQMFPGYAERIRARRRQFATAHPRSTERQRGSEDYLRAVTEKSHKDSPQ